MRNHSFPFDPPIWIPFLFYPFPLGTSGKQFITGALLQCIFFSFTLSPDSLHWFLISSKGHCYLESCLENL